MDFLVQMPHTNNDVLHHRKYLDPALANTGVSDSKKLKHDVVCASTLNRAIETALLMFPRETIHVIPYAKEIRKTQDNTFIRLPTKLAPGFIHCYIQRLKL